jgi:hypothetical protein
MSMPAVQTLCYSTVGAMPASAMTFSCDVASAVVHWIFASSVRALKPQLQCEGVSDDPCMLARLWLGRWELG